LAQLTASSFLGIWGNTVRRTAETLLKKRLIHCIATDAHGLSKRPPGVNRSLQCVSKWLDPTHIYQMIETCPATIINNAL